MRHKAGQATYAGDVEHIVGEVKGPTTFGTWLLATDAHYDPETDLTVVEWSTTTPDELVRSDEHGALRLVTS